MNAESTLNQTASTAAPAAAKARPVRPAGWAASLGLFGLPALALIFAFYVFRPWLETRGYSEITSYLGALVVPLALIFSAALIAYHRVEGRPFTRAAFAERMRYPRLRLRDVLWGLAIFAGGMLGYGLFSAATITLARSGLLPLPANLPLLANPLAAFDPALLDQAAGGQIKGQWEIALLFVVLYFFNIAGEELWWRGYILPRQELAFGRLTWLVHGSLWAAFHAFKYWDILPLLPVCLLIAYASTRFKNNWPGFIAHALMNVGGVLLVVLAVL